METNKPLDFWEKTARAWAAVRSPVRPHAEDQTILAGEISRWLAASGRKNVNAAVLGVTQELCRVSLPAGSRILALDRSPEMIGAVWPGPVYPGDQAILADWRENPLASGSIDLFLGDGCPAVLPWPAGCARFFGALRAPLRDDGRFIIRIFLQYDPPESIDAIISDLDAGRIRHFDVLKWRILLASQPSVEQGVVLADAWQAYNAVCPDPYQFEERFGWTRESLDTINFWRTSRDVAHFASLAQYEAAAAEAGFRFERVIEPSYPMGEVCPTIVMAPMA